MFARVYDKKRNRYYKSIIYCAINNGYYRQYVVINPNTSSFELIDYLDKDGEGLKPLVETICASQDDWVSYQNAQLLKYKAYCKNNNIEVSIDVMSGYKDVCENYAFISDVIERKSVPINETDILIRNVTDDEWNYIQSQEDADEFMKLFAGFHDSTLDRLCYEECFNSTKVTATFDNSGWYGVVELCFEGILAVNICPAKENYSREIFGATLLVRDETVIWAERDMENEDLSSDSSYIKALNLKWRKIG